MFKKSDRELKVEELQLKINLINTLNDLECDAFTQSSIDEYIKELVIDVFIDSKNLGRI